MKTYFETMHIENMNLPNINVIAGGIQQCPPSYKFGPVTRQCYLLFYIMNGKGTYIANGISHQVSKGLGFIIRPYEPHVLQADINDPWEHLWVIFECDITLPEILTTKYTFDATEYTDIFSKIIEIHKGGDDALAMSTQLYTLFAKMHAKEKRTKAVTDVIDKAIEIINTEYSTITIGALSDRLFMNRSYFGAKFKAKTGKSPKKYIDSIRLSTATKLIHEFGYSVSQAANYVGYSDRTVFSKMYKKYYGISPKAGTSNKKGKTIILK